MKKTKSLLKGGKMEEKNNGLMVIAIIAILLAIASSMFTVYTIQTVNEKIKDINQEQIIPDMSYLELSISNLKANLNGTETTLRALDKVVYSNIMKINNIDGIDSRDIDDLYELNDDLEDDIKQLERDFGNYDDNDFDNFNDDISKLKSDVNGLESDLGDYDTTEFSGFNNSITNLNTNVADLEISKDNLNNTVIDLKEFEDKLNACFGGFVNITHLVNCITE